MQTIRAKSPSGHPVTITVGAEAYSFTSDSESGPYCKGTFRKELGFEGYECHDTFGHSWTPYEPGTDKWLRVLGFTRIDSTP